MNKKLLILCLFMMPLVASLESNAMGREINLHVGYINPNVISNTRPKAPLRIPSLFIDGTTLYFDEAWQGHDLVIYKDGVPVYSNIVQGTTLNLLSILEDLDGDIEIELEYANRKFYGTLEIIQKLN